MLLSMKRSKVIVILGQTSAGKSDLAVEIALRLRSGPSAKKYGGEIISADSRQVYSGLDLGTGKVTKKEMKGVPHYLLDIANPKQKFTVVDYKELAEKKIKEIIERGKIPIICGGTGFYIDTVVLGKIFPNVPPNEKLRKILFKKSTKELFEMLKKIDSTRVKTIDKNNKIKIIRAIEIAKTLGKVPKITEVKPQYKFIKIGLYVPSEILKQRINDRLLKRIKIGMLNEAKKLHKKGLSWKRMRELGLEYRYMALYLQGKITKAEMVEKLNSEIYHYAKRQLTWFKRDKEIKWLAPSEVEGFLKKF